MRMNISWRTFVLLLLLVVLGVALVHGLPDTRESVLPPAPPRPTPRASAPHRWASSCASLPTEHAAALAERPKNWVDRRVSHERRQRMIAACVCKAHCAAKARDVCEKDPECCWDSRWADGLGNVRVRTSSPSLSSAFSRLAHPCVPLLQCWGKGNGHCDDAFFKRHSGL